MTVTKSTKSTSVATTADAVAAAKARLAKVVADPTRPEGKPAARAARKPAAKPVVERDAEAARELAIGEADARAAYEAEQAKSVNDDVQPAKLVDVVVVGPNLQTRTGETFHVHSPKCADRKRPVYARTDHQN
jgi:hypothetical protein